MKFFKRLNKLSWLLLLLISLGACQENKEVSTILSGKLPNQKGNTIALVPIDEYFPGLKTIGEQITTQVDSTGLFTFKSPAIIDGFYQIIQGNYHVLQQDLYVELGDSLFIKQSVSNDIPLLNISGKGAEKLSYLLADHKLFPKDKRFYDTIKSTGFKTEFQFKDFIDATFEKRLAAVESNSAVPEKLKSYFLKALQAEKAYILLEHLERRNYYMTGEFIYFYPDSTYYSFLDGVQFDEEFSRSTAAKILANAYVQNQARIHFRNKDEEKWWNENLSWKLKFVENSTKSRWSDLMALSTIQEYSLALDQPDFFENLDSFEHKRDTSFDSELLRNVFNTNILEFQNIAPGKLAPNFELPDANGDLHALSDFKGKIVYIDFWGTWCGPCVEEIPRALALQEKYKDSPVVFLYVALEYDEEDINNWKEFISGSHEQSSKLLNNKPFPGIHWVAEKQFRNEQLTPYKLNFAPTHILLDHEGNIVSARAKRPANISEEIDKLLKDI